MSYGTSFEDLTFVGMIGLMDPAREGVKESIEWLKNNNIQLKIITGDSDVTASAIANQIGLEQLKTMNANDLNDDTTDELINMTNIFYRSTPKQKLMIIKRLKQQQKQEYIVAMTGDGVNDAIALKSADVGIVMGLYV